MHVQISQWGNSLGVRIPKAFAEILGLDKGMQAQMTFENNRIIIEPKTQETGFEAFLKDTPTLEELMEGMVPYDDTDENWDFPLLESEMWEYEGEE